MEQTLVEKLKWAGLFWLAKRLPDCKTLAPKLGESMDRRLSLRERIVNRLHLITCEACQLYLKQISFISSALRDRGSCLDVSNLAESGEMRPEAKEKLKQTLNKSQEPNA